MQRAATTPKATKLRSTLTPKSACTFIVLDPPGGSPHPCSKTWTPRSSPPRSVATATTFTHGTTDSMVLRLGTPSARRRVLRLDAQRWPHGPAADLRGP